MSENENNEDVALFCKGCGFEWWANEIEDGKCPECGGKDFADTDIGLFPTIKKYQAGWEKTIENIGGGI